MRDESPREQEELIIHDFVLTNREEADHVLNELKRLTSDGDFASVGHLYVLLGMPDTYLSWQWGWRDLQAAKVVQDDDGYRLDLPAIKNVNDKCAMSLTQKLEDLLDEEK